LSQPELEDKGTTYIFSWKECQIKAAVSGLHEHKDGRITCALKFTTSNPEYNEYLLEQTFNLMGTAMSKTALKNALLKAYSVKVDWDEIISQICGITLDRLRAGEPVHEVWTDDAVYPLEYKLYPILPEGEPTLCFADGGSGKSSMGLFIATCIALPWTENPLGFKPKSVIAGKPLYLDWETNKATFTRRIAWLRRGHDLPEFAIAYRRCHIPLVDDINAVHTICRENAFDTLIIDSVIGAAKGNINDSEVAQELFRAIRRLNLTSFIIHHTSKQTITTSKTPFGSTYFSNLARSVWELTKSQEVGSNQLNVLLTHYKSNDDTKHLPIGVKIEFDKTDGKTVFSKFDPEKSSEFDAKLPAAKRISKLLRGGPLEIKQISEELGIPYAQVKGRLNELKGKIFTKLDDNRWGLITVEI
jgi:hypothetical protein